MNKRVLLLLLGVLLSACSWVDVSPQAEHVEVLTAAQASSCKLVGRATVSVLDRVLMVSRSEKIVHEELERLGRNAAADMGGDAIVADGAVVKGEQVFQVYRCKS